ncbi:hypothetical protein M378DRAFT_564887 [Amanita muscaria Koide BX008]|uniref:Uncharacterized protein n=1 Tax=Amanita muscaria (strain Koide BX008) TaxID=946122 RepID=A0A0C2X6C5_AMAMK|nr:hypothetical protein M378DRAFT_564887 [Amanita muscaria Koide BX008]
MLSSDSEISCQQSLQNSQTNHKNDGIIGDGSYNIISSGNNSHVNIAQATKAEEEDVELDRMLNGFVSKDALHNFKTRLCYQLLLHSSWWTESDIKELGACCAQQGVRFEVHEMEGAIPARVLMKLGVSVTLRGTFSFDEGL